MLKICAFVSSTLNLQFDQLLGTENDDARTSKIRAKEIPRILVRPPTNGTLNRV